MMSISLSSGDDFKHPRFFTQIDLFSDSPVNHALTTVAQEVAELVQQASSFENETIAIRVIDLEYRQFITAEPLTKRELEVLQLIVDGYSNDGIAQNLYISTGRVKTHVRNILKKLCANDV
ncbi:MAG: helix-turn-helix domain-containing protein [Waterburya sp.]